MTRFRAGVAVLHGSARCATVRVAIPPHVLVVPPQKDAGSRACARVRATKRRLQASGRPMPPFRDPTLHVRPPRAPLLSSPRPAKGGHLASRGENPCWLNLCETDLTTTTNGMTSWSTTPHDELTRNASDCHVWCKPTRQD